MMTGDVSVGDKFINPAVNGCQSEDIFKKNTREHRFSRALACTPRYILHRGGLDGW